MAHPEAYLIGIKLFNQGAYWEAHEEWEEVWKAQEGEHRRFIQGLIQMAAALVHWQRGNRRGLQLNWGKARPKLADVPSPYWGLNLRPVIASMDALVAGTETTAPRLHIHH